MAGPIVYVDRSEIHEGRADEVRAAVRGLAEFVEANEPEIVSYAAYVDDDGRAMTVIHVHRDPASLTFHLQVAGPKFAPFAPLLRLRSIEVFGEAGPTLLEQLQAKARALGGATVTVHPLQAGFVRLAAAS